jgi:hypothetical protein
VIRDGQRKRITGREVVRGDVLVLAERDRDLTNTEHLHNDWNLLRAYPLLGLVGSSATKRCGCNSGVSYR